MSNLNLNLKYQVSIFGDFSNIDANPSCTIKLLELFRELNFIPSTFQEIMPNNFQNFANSSNIRPLLSSMNNEWVINFGSQRIDVTKNPVTQNTNNMGNISSFVETVLKYFAMLQKEFDIKSNRIALISEGLYPEMKEDKLNTIYKQLFNGIDYYNDHIPFEWNWRLVAKEYITVGLDKESINMISALSRVRVKLPNELKEEDRLSLNFDINTIPQNTRIRFNVDNMKVFFDKALATREKIIKDMEMKICVTSKTSN